MAKSMPKMAKKGKMPMHPMPDGSMMPGPPMKKMPMKAMKPTKKGR